MSSIRSGTLALAVLLVGVAVVAGGGLGADDGMAATATPTTNESGMDGEMEETETMNGGMEETETMNGGMEETETMNGGMEETMDNTGEEMGDGMDDGESGGLPLLPLGIAGAILIGVGGIVAYRQR